MSPCLLTPVHCGINESYMLTCDKNTALRFAVHVEFCSYRQAKSIQRGREAIWSESVITGNHNRGCSSRYEGNSITSLGLFWGKLSDGKWMFYSNERKKKQIDFMMKFHFQFSHLYSVCSETSSVRSPLIHAHTKTHAHRILCMANCAETLCWAVISNRRQHTGALLTQRCCKTALSPTPTHKDRHTHMCTRTHAVSLSHTRNRLLR